MRKYKKNTLLEVNWVDVVEESEWLSEATMNKRPDADCKTVGYFYKVDKEFLYLSGTISKTERNRTAIPLGVIRKVQKLQ